MKNVLLSIVLIFSVNITKAQKQLPDKVLNDFVYWLAYSYDNNYNTHHFISTIFDAKTKGDVSETFELLPNDKATQNKVFRNLAKYHLSDKEFLSWGMPSNSVNILISYLSRLGN